MICSTHILFSTVHNQVWYSTISTIGAAVGMVFTHSTGEERREGRRNSERDSAISFAGEVGECCSRIVDHRRSLSLVLRKSQSVVEVVRKTEKNGKQVRKCLQGYD